MTNNTNTAHRSLASLELYRGVTKTGVADWSAPVTLLEK
jgi:hypothetical protein